MLQAAQVDQITKGLTTITNWVKVWAVPLAAIGTVSMALLQIAKNILPLRSAFQRKALREWLRTRGEDAAGDAEKDLIELTTAGDAEAFYNSSIEDLCGQMKGAVPVILDYPDKHEKLLRCLASEASDKDTVLLLNPPAMDLFFKPAAHSTREEKEEVRLYAAAKLRVGVQVRCAIDAIQSHVGFRWKRRLQILSLLLSAALGLIALFVSADAGVYPSIGATLVVGLLAGFLAPVARDLVAAVEKWRS
jgi:hypothetical protein